MFVFLGCPSLGAGAAGTRKFFIVLNSRGDLSLDSLVSPPLAEERLKDWSRFAPLVQANTRNPRQLHFVIGQGAVNPIVYYEKQVCAVQRG